MLYDKVKKAIAMRKKRIVFARTALEIKSSVGAKPKDLCIYLRYENSMVNKIVSPIISVLNPTEKWVPRHPFKSWIFFLEFNFGVITILLFRFTTHQDVTASSAVWDMPTHFRQGMPNLISLASLSLRLCTYQPTSTRISHAATTACPWPASCYSHRLQKIPIY